MNESTKTGENKSYRPQDHERLDHLNDELSIVRRWLSKPNGPLRSEDADILRLAIDRIHGLYEGLAFEMRRDAQAKTDGGR